MKKYGRKTRDIVFFSAKNQTTLCVHTPQARRYAKLPEEDTRIRSYEVNHPLDAAWIARIDRVGIRGAYLQTQWTTDFVITDQDGGEAVREIVTATKENAAISPAIRNGCCGFIWCKTCMTCRIWLQ